MGGELQESGKCSIRLIRLHICYISNIMIVFICSIRDEVLLSGAWMKTFVVLAAAD